MGDFNYRIEALYEEVKERARRFKPDDRAALLAQVRPYYN